MENQVTEWKVKWDNDNLRTIAAFANSGGGKMIVGIKDNGEAVGVQNPKKLLTEIPNTIRNTLGFSADVRDVTENGKTIIEITVKPQDDPKSLRGIFYVRSGSTTVELEGTQLRRFILKDMSWTDLPANKIKMEELSQDAIDTFVKMGTILGRMSPLAKESSNESLLRRYKLMDDEGLRNSAAILFMEYPAMVCYAAAVKIGAFSENDRLLRHDKIDCPVILQPDRVMNVLLNKYILGTDDVELARRVTRYPYPVRALREAVINAISHRDFSSVTETYIRVYPDHVSISNPGMLPAGWTEGDLFKKHDSKPANPNIAEAFYDAGLIEGWGAGVELIRRECEAMGLPQPEYVLERGRVEITFRLPPKAPTEKIPEKADAADGLKVIELRVYNIITEGNATTRREIAELIGMSDSVVKRAIASLTEKELIKRIGSNKDGRWVKIAK
ncbi:MAG: putative DNA binding domain-containing protein [Candidatus Methanoplasma sp.]|jgi:ATP-dependent DNA helicase RecG|nr:putative DNA binding domain-containing protein [Candidatus Methanoplasma sp.]